MGTVTIANGANIQNAINSNPSGTTFLLSDGTYTGQQIQPKSGDQLIGASDGGTVFNGGGSATPLTAGNSGTGVVFENITTTNYNTPNVEAPIETGSGWQLINVTSTNNVGAGLVLGANSVVRGGNYSNNGVVGIVGSNANGAQVLNAVIEGNNTSNSAKDVSAGGVKIVGSASVVISGNVVANNNGMGIWADENDSNWTISGNYVANNNYNGILFEISHGANITNNSLAGNTGAGIFISNSDSVTTSGNVVTVGASNNGIATFHANGGIDIVNITRGTDPNGVLYQAINDTVTNNSIIHTTDSAPDGIFYEVPVSGNANNVWNNNTYYVPNTTQTYWFFPNTAYPIYPYTFSQLQQQTPYESSGKEIVSGPVAATAESSPTAASSDVASITSGSLTAGMPSTGPTFVVSSPASATAASSGPTADFTLAAAMATSIPPNVTVQPSSTFPGTSTSDATAVSGADFWLTNPGTAGGMYVAHG